jgi:putative endopeptidase
LETTAVQKLAQVFDATPLDTSKAWETLHFAGGASPYLSKRFAESE